MKVDVSALVNSDKVSSERSWSRIEAYLDRLETADKEDIVINFDTLVVVEPWKFEAFDRIMKKYPSIKFEVFDNEDLVKTFDAACLLKGYEVGKITNIPKVVVIEKTKEEKKLERIQEEVFDYICIKDGNMYVYLVDKFSQFCDTKYATAFMLDAEKYAEIYNKRDCKFIIETEDMLVSDKVMFNVTRDGAKLKRERGIDTYIFSNIKETSEKFALHKFSAEATNVSNAERLQIISKFMYKNMAGLLTEYKNGRKKDSFGRSGDGEKVSCKPCIYLGCSGVGEEVVITIRVFSNKTFFTQEHWQMENDNESLSELDYSDLKIKLSELGVMNKFLGTRYHFMAPVQRSTKDYEINLVLNDGGFGERNKVTIPEKMKAVFDAWNVEYDEAGLERAVSKSKEILKQLEIEEREQEEDF